MYFSYPSVPSIDSLSFDFGTVIGLAGTDIRMDAAKEYLARARDYRDDIKLRIANVKSVIISVDAVRDALTEESLLLENIKTAYQKASEDKLLKTTDILHQIAEICMKEVNDYTATQYKTLIDRLNALWR